MRRPRLKAWQPALLALVLASTACACARPAQVILLRHAEKPTNEADIHLSEQGRERAQALVAFFTTNPAVTNRGRPAVLFAPLVTHRGHSRRPSETLEPLAKQLKLPIRTPFLAADYARLAQQVLTSPECDGKTVVICWVHENLPELAGALGVKPTPPRWKDHVFDRVWVIRGRGDRTKLKDLPQRLLPGDSQH
jgi:hypothetical protein